MKHWLAVILLALALFNPPATFAQARSVQVDRRDGDITLLPNGDVRVVETWQVKFTGAPGFTQAFRTLPLGAVREFADWSVSEDGQAYSAAADHSPRTFTVTDDANGKRITWYFPETLNATRTFVLSYTARGILRAAPSREQLNWTFIEADRGYTINASRVVLHLPKTFSPNDIKTSANGRVIDGQTVEYTGGPFAASVAWTLNVEYPLTTPNIPTLTPPTQVALARRDADITLLPNDTAQFVETWQIQVQGGPINKATRSFALYHVDDLTQFQVNEDKVVYTKDILRVPHTFDVQRGSAGGLIWLTWYFEPTTNAARVITLRYTASGVIHQANQGDEFNWTFIEADRDYAIANARVTLHLPGNFEASRIAATASSGSARVVDGSTVEFTAGPIPPQQAWSTQTQFPHGALKAGLPQWQIVAEQQPTYNLISLFAAVLVLVGGAAGFYLLWFTRGREPARGLLAEYITAPPENLPPGIAGALLDERVDQPDLVATLVDLARRGFIRISAAKHATNRYVRQNADPPALRPYERVLLDEMFRFGKEIDSGKLRHVFATQGKKIRAAFYDELVSAGWFAVNPERVRANFAAAGCFATLLIGVLGLFVYLWIADYAPYAICVWLALLVLAFAPVVLSGALPKRTAQGVTLAALVRAFKRYLENIDQYTQVAAAKDQFEKYLPYAIAFGLEKTWVKTFAAADTPAPQWYEPYTHTPAPTSHPHASTTPPAASTTLPASSASRSQTSAHAAASEDRAAALDDAARGAFVSLEAMSAGLFTMLDTTAQLVTGKEPPRAHKSSGGGSSSFSNESGSSSSWNSSSSSSNSSSSSSSNTGGGGSSGFG